MKNPIVALDELVLSGYEKVSQVAHKRLGWDKYDLAKISYTVATGGLSGIGVYSTIFGMQTNNTFSLVLGGICTPGGLVWYFGHKRDQEKLQKFESKIITEKEATLPYIFDPIRLAVFGIGLYSISLFATRHITGSVEPIPAAVQGHAEQYNAIKPLVDTISAPLSLALASVRYFWNCTRYPPKKNKVPLWKRALNYVKSKVTPTPELQPQEIKRYQTIDEVI